MRKKVFFLLIAVMSLSLLGIIFIQGYWIKEALDSKEAQFSFNARQSLIQVANKVKNQEIDDYYVKYASMADDTLAQPTEANFSQLFQVEKDEVTNETYILTNSILEEDYKLRSEIPGSDQDSIDFKKLVNRKVKLVRKDDRDGEMGLTAPERFERVSRLEETEKELFLEAIKDKVDKEPIYNRIDKDELKKLVDNELKLRNIKSDYDFGIFSNGLSTKVASSNFDRKSQASYGISVFPSENTNYKLYINFKEKQKEIFSSIVWMAGLSVVFTIIIIMAYAGAIYQLIKQRRISEIKTDFINNMTHEFKTPIATINLALDSMANPKVSEKPKKLKTYMKMIRDENHRMHAQVENVLRISKLERNELDIKKERLELHDLIGEAITHVKLIVENHQGYVKKHLEADKSTILANKSHFVNVLVNILDNGIKYSNESPKLDVFTENANDYIILKISDQGKGMSKAAQNQIFNKFFREHTGDLHDVKGHGLGLAYAKKIIDDHQGEISVESEKDKGSTFIIKLPLIS